MAIKSRTVPLTAVEQHAMVNVHIPSRIRVIEQCLINKPHPSYVEMTAAGIFSRALAGFLGIGVGKGVLKADSDYFEQSKGQSWEVKITDIAGGVFVDLVNMSPNIRQTLIDGLSEVNLAFAHLTFWSSPTDQTATALPTPKYNRTQEEKLRAMARLVVQLYNQQSTLFRV